ncbi:MAG: tRNA pseudouridine(38-40) synthase TruA [Chloroflexota bacterium]|nr:tRNA pseudouridine(38-40) synthase TruA [Chloroflexota bacterium]
MTKSGRRAGGQAGSGGTAPVRASDCPADAEPTSELPDSRRLRLTLAYDGTEFYGAQVQPGRRTVGGELEGALARLAGAASRVTFAGRTDRGVHAAGQVAHCDVATGLADDRLRQALNAILPGDLAVLALATVPGGRAGFHARYDACWREYRYRIWNAPTRVPELARTSWHLARPLDLDALNGAAARLRGEHDFAAFAGQGLGAGGGAGRATGRVTIRRVDGAEWRRWKPDLPAPLGTMTELRIRASGFLPQMVRTIVATLVEVGLGRRDGGWVTGLLEGRNRGRSPAPAPPHGLTLWSVGYAE